MKKTSKKGIALLMVAVLILVAVPTVYVFFNLSSSQREQALNFDSALNVELLAFSGLNKAHAMLRNNYNDGYMNLPGEILGDSRYDINITPTGNGFFLQNIYMLVSHSSDKKGKHNSIVMADAEQFKLVGKISNLAITHDYWVTNEPYNIGLKADVLGIKNSRGQEQLRNLDIKKFEMEASKKDYGEAIEKLMDDLPQEMRNVWPEVTKRMVIEKINNKGIKPNDIASSYLPTNKFGNKSRSLENDTNTIRTINKNLKHGRTYVNYDDDEDEDEDEEYGSYVSEDQKATTGAEVEVEVDVNANKSLEDSDPSQYGPNSGNYDDPDYIDTTPKG